MTILISAASTRYFIKSLDKNFKFSADFWKYVEGEYDIIPMDNVEGKNAMAKRIYDEFAAVAIPRICKKHGVTPDDIELYISIDYFEEIGVFKYHCDRVVNMEISAPTPESQAAIDVLRNVNPCVDYPGSRVWYYCSSDYDEFEAWQEICEYLIKSHYIDPVAERFELDANDFTIDYFEHDFY